MDNKFLKNKEKERFIIDNDKKFRDTFGDASNQFLAIWIHSQKENITLEELQEINKKIQYLDFVDYLKNKKVPQTLSPQIANDEKYKQLIFIYDDLIKRIKDFKSINELKQISEEVTEFIRTDF